MATATKAIIMAAGTGKRMQPVTLTTPKPLVKVNGVRMIDTIIDGLHKNHIYEIYIVVGYLKEQFEQLKEKYDGLTFIENPYYNETNNISSLFVAREFLGDTIILDGDQIVANPDILNPEFEKSGYCAFYQENQTDEWLMTVEDNTVLSCSRTGGSHGWQLFSVSKWNQEDGKKLQKHLEEEFLIRNNRQIYWDDIPMFVHKDEYNLGVHRINPGDITEIDNLSELAMLDESYLKYME